MQNSSVQQEEPWLPPGFRFHPTDEELVLFYLREKVHDSSFTDRSIGEADFNKCEPWDLPGMAKMGEKEWYLYSTRDRKYPTGMRTNRATEAGYWKTTGKDRPIMDSRNKQQRCLIGMKKTLVFYTGRAPKGQKTNWVMHEYRIEGDNLDYLPKSSRDKWVLCRVFLKGPGGKKVPLSEIRKPLPPPSSSSSSYLPSLRESPEWTESKSNPALTEEIGVSDYLPSMDNYDLYSVCKQEPYLPSDYYQKAKDEPLIRRHVSITGSSSEDQLKQPRFPNYQPYSFLVNTPNYPGFLNETASSMDCNRLARFPSESALDMESIWAFPV